MPARNRETCPYTAPQARTVGLRFPNWTRFNHIQRTRHQSSGKNLRRMNAKRNKKRMSVVPREAPRVLPDAAFIDAAHSPTVLPLFPPRRFLFLQGVPGSFLHVLGLALTRRGHSVFRVNFNGGDRMAWPLLPATDFRARMTEWPSFLQRLILDFAPTDMVLGLP